ncbi:hypothetical protein AGMMS49957_15340 [Synergistales bacterium]|nr:hypothetical protein AGMMS49957_15340 [Synergistales bacterium]
MKKIAIFVEGQTEQYFTSELVKQIFGEKKIAVEIQQFSGSVGRRNFTIIQTATRTTATDYYFVIYNCCGDSTVKSDIIEQLPTLSKQSFSSVIGIRDAYPLTDIAKLKSSLAYGVPTHGIPIHIILAINEIEAWFIAEELHYAKISPKLLITSVNKIAEIDVTVDSTEILHHPAETLKKIYNSVGVGYRKRKSEVQRTVHALDYGNLYIEVRRRNDSLNELLDCLDNSID